MSPTTIAWSRKKFASSTGSLDGKRAESVPESLLPSAVAMNHTPRTSPVSRSGASLLIVLSPTGLRHISPSVCRK